MKFKVKKFIYLLNDITGIILKKDRVEAEENAKKLRFALIIVSIALALSIVFNVYFLINDFAS